MSEYVQVVLVEAQTVYTENRIDHASRLQQFRRPAVVKPGQPMMALMVPRPSPTLFEDRFVGIYPVLEAFQLYSVPVTAQNFALTYRVSTRLDDPDPEQQFHRVDHGKLFAFIQGKAAPAFLAYTFEIPDLNDNPWLEWVPAHPPADLFPFRQIYTKPPVGQPPTLMSWQSPNWKIEAEADSRGAVNHGAIFYPFRQIPVVQPTFIIRVMAVQVGFYFSTRNIGDVFDADIQHFADSAVDYIVGQIGDPFFGWMVIVSPLTPLLANSPTPLNTANKPRTVL